MGLLSLKRPMKQKTILITGATGFLGSSITQELLEAGFRLKLLVRKRIVYKQRKEFLKSFHYLLHQCLQIELDGPYRNY